MSFGPAGTALRLATEASLEGSQGSSLLKSSVLEKVLARRGMRACVNLTDVRLHALDEVVLGVGDYFETATAARHDERHAPGIHGRLPPSNSCGSLTSVLSG
jgi:hypothetical protein